MAQTLLIPASYPIDISIEYQVIQRFYAGGHDKSEVVGPTDGIMLLGLSFNVLPMGAQLTVNDPENGGAATPWARYLWRFYNYRMGDQAAFNVGIEDPETGATMTQLFKFADPRLTMQLITWKLYTASGVQLRQWRALT